MKDGIKKRGAAQADVVAGAIQEAVGHVLGNETMEAKGEARQIVGHAREKAAKVAERTQGVVEEVLGTAKDEAGKLLGDTEMEVTGKLKKLKGKARQAANR